MNTPKHPPGTRIQARALRGRIAIAALVFCMSGAAVLLASSGTAGTENTKAPPKEHTWHHYSLNIPGGWKQRESAADHALWVSADAARTVTIGRAASDMAALRTIVGQTAQTMQEDIRGYANGAVRIVDGKAGSVAHTFDINNGGQSIHVIQLWKRFPANDEDVIATWTMPPGTTITPLGNAAPRFEATATQ